MKTSTIPVQAPAWYIVDAADQKLGRVAAKVAHVLKGKHKASYSPHQLCGDCVIIINVEKLDISANKAMKKVYFHHTGYPGHMQRKTLAKMLEKSPVVVMEKAIQGMLAPGRQRSQILKRLHVIQGSEHKYAPQKPVPLDISTL